MPRSRVFHALGAMIAMAVSARPKDPPRALRTCRSTIHFFFGQLWPFPRTTSPPTIPDANHPCRRIAKKNLFAAHGRIPGPFPFTRPIPLAFVDQHARVHPGLVAPRRLARRPQDRRRCRPQPRISPFKIGAGLCSRPASVPDTLGRRTRCTSYTTKRNPQAARALGGRIPRTEDEMPHVSPPRKELLSRSPRP